MNILVTYTLSTKDTVSEFRKFYALHHGKSACVGTSWCITIDGDQYWFVPDSYYPKWIVGRTYTFLDDLKLFHSGVYQNVT